MRKVNFRNVDPAIDDPDASTWCKWNGYHISALDLRSNFSSLVHPTLNRHSPPEVIANFPRASPNLARTTPTCLRYHPRALRLVPVPSPSLWLSVTDHPTKVVAREDFMLPDLSRHSTSLVLLGGVLVILVQPCRP